MVARLREKRKGISKHELVRDESFWGLCPCRLFENQNATKGVYIYLDMNVMWFQKMNHRLVATVSTFHHVLSDLHV